MKRRIFAKLAFAATVLLMAVKIGYSQDTVRTKPAPNGSTEMKQGAHEIKEGAKEVGRGTEKTAKGVAHKTKSAAKSAVRHTKKAAHDVKNDFKRDSVKAK